MSLRPLPLAVFFPPEPKPKSQCDSRPSEVEQAAKSKASTHDQTASHKSEEAVTSSSNARSTSSVARTRDESSSHTWDDTDAFEAGRCEEEYWADGSDEEDEDATGSGQASKHVWLSDEEKQRVAFRRARTSAQRVDLDRSPFFPATLAEYVGLKAGVVEERAARLRAKVEAREAILRALERAESRSVFVVGPSGQIEERLIPICHGEVKSAEPKAQPSSAARKGKGKARAFGAGLGAERGALGKERCEGPSTDGPTTSIINVAAYGVQASYFPHAGTVSFDATDHWAQPSYLAYSITNGWIALNTGNFVFCGTGPFPAHEENGAWPSTDAAWFGPQAHNTFGGHYGLASPFSYGGGHQRTRSAEFLKEVASHAAVRRGRFEERDEQKTGSTHNRHGWFEDDAYDSDSSFTPSDYRPTRNVNHGQGVKCVPSLVQESTIQLRNAITTSDFVTQPEKVAGEGYKRMDVAERDFELKHSECKAENHGSSDSEVSSFTPSDYKVGGVGYYTTLDGKQEPKGKGKEDAYKHDVSGEIEDGYKYTNGNKAMDNAIYQRGQNNASLEVKHIKDQKKEHIAAVNYNAQRNTLNKPNNTTDDNNPVTTTPSTPSSASTFTPSDYDPRKLASNKLKLNLHSSLPFSPFIKPTLATLPLTHIDGHTAVLARPNNPFTPSHHPPECDWPTTAELTSEGDSRIKRTDFVPVYDADPVFPDPYSMPYISPLQAPFGDLSMSMSGPGMMAPAPTLGPGPAPGVGQGQPAGNLGRYLPVPRLKNTVDPRLGLTQNEVDSLVQAHGGLPWEVRVMVGERWDLHAQRRIWEVWRARFEDEEEGWDRLEEEGGVGVRMARGMVGWEEEGDDWVGDGYEEGGEDEEVGKAGKKKKGEEEGEEEENEEGEKKEEEK